MTRTHTPVERHAVDINGLRNFYRAAGIPTHPVIVPLHGFPSSSHMFRDLMPLLADRFRVIPPDSIGFGRSAAPTAAQVQASLRHLSVTDTSCCMQDFGGPVVQNASACLEGPTPAAAGAFMPPRERDDETGARHPERLNPDAWVLDQALLDRPGSTERQSALFEDYRNKVPLSDVWQASHHPPAASIGRRFP